ncbi:MAG: hypothetical protein BMS9Abin37_0617 [Acidobacteriota bacterium]|nr:MAG: hypothetical protein BMS9Abin37_0617 [Acidobacteriota bacterium]
MSSPLVTQFRRGGVSRDVRLTAASGALPLSPADQVELLFLLTRDQDEEVSQQADSSLQALDEASLVGVLKEEATSVDVLAFFGTRVSSDEVQQALVRNPSTPDATVAILVPKLTETNLEFVVVNQTRLLRHAPVLTALEANENLNYDQQRRIKELKFDFKLDRPAAEAEPLLPSVPLAPQKLDLGTGPAEEEKPPPRSTEEAEDLYGASDDVNAEATEEEQAEKKSLIAQLVTMSAAEKMMKALKGEREARMMLIRDRNRTVWSAVLSSPKMNESDAEQIAKMRNVAPDVLREIAKNRQFVKRYTVAHELVKNPKTPHEVSSKLLARLKDRDLKRLIRDRNVSEQVRRLAKKRTRTNK